MYVNYKFKVKIIRKKEIRKEKVSGISNKDQEAATSPSDPGLQEVWEKLPPLESDAQNRRPEGKAKFHLDLEDAVREVCTE